MNRDQSNRPLVTPAAGLGYGAHVAYCWRWLALKQREEKGEDFLLRRW